MQYLREIFDDWTSRAAAVVFLLIVGLFVFNLYSDLPEKYPFLGALTFSMVPLLFIAGGIVFVLAILKELGDRNNNAKP